MPDLTPSALLKLQAFAFIEAAIVEKGYVGTPELCRAFSASRQTAIKFLNGYKTEHPEQIIYCPTRRRYLAHEHFGRQALGRFAVSAADYLKAIETLSLYDPSKGIFYVKKGVRKPRPQKEKPVSTIQPPPRVTEAKLYQWQGQNLSIAKIARLSGVSKWKLYPRLKTVEQHSDITDLVDGLR